MSAYGESNSNLNASPSSPREGREGRKEGGGEGGKEEGKDRQIKEEMERGRKRVKGADKENLYL